LGAAAHLTTSDCRWLSPLALWTGILAAPMAWAGDLTASYAIVKWACLTQNEAPLRIIALAALLIALGGGVIAWVSLTHTMGSAPTDGGHPRQRARFMAQLGLASSAFFAVTIAAGTIPQWVLHACD
jgi:hypothetical protein